MSDTDGPVGRRASSRTDFTAVALDEISFSMHGDTSAPGTRAPTRLWGVACAFVSRERMRLAESDRST